ncbi:MAG TPA: DNA repair protein RecN [Candidatus Caccovivens faecavium]|nr:DNA repair protein RecN [Candidatus Caccovivens faecavium]
MLSSLFISNFALIKTCEINFNKGFNVILGQSGAGKSILIDAISFVLGAKADKTLMRTGENLMKVEAVFDNISEKTKKKLEDIGVECDDELIISRSLNSDGKSVIRVNGSVVVLKNLRDITEDFVDFCGQHDSVGLINVNNHLALLDSFIGREAEEHLKTLNSYFDELQEIDKKIKALGGDDAERNRLKEILKFQIDEIENANLITGEEEELKEKFNYISASEKISENLSLALNYLERESVSASGLVFDAKALLSSLSEFDNISDCQDRLNSVYYELKDIAETLENILDNTDYDPVSLERIDKRLDLIKDLKRKYGKNIEEILKFLKDAKGKLEELNNGEELLTLLDRQRSELLGKIEDASSKLSALRKEKAKAFESKLEKELNDLQMKGTSFKVNFEKGELSRKGQDEVKFVFSANIGEELKDLSKTASGGELSRLLLAFKNIMLDKESTVIFDEIDSGISGQTAGKVAEKLKNISKYLQTICITHTPVVASKGDEFILVTKESGNGETVSNAQIIHGDEVVREIANLIDGSEKISKTAINHAKELLLKK